MQIVRQICAEVLTMQTRHIARWSLLLLLLPVFVGEGCGEVSERCSTYCKGIVACGFDLQPSCETRCESRTSFGADPYGERCVLNEDCAAASLCILCDQYCERLDECSLSTTSCSSSCRTNLEGGADEGSYQCVIDAANCEEVPNCGI